MSHSRVFDEYAKILVGNKIIKTADKKDGDYDIVIPAAGSDTPVESDGWELIEIAHPEQSQVARSGLEDGIVENIVERQKVMVDVALRNPRGIIAELMQALVKAANVLEDEMTDESLKMAQDIDVVLEKLAQQVNYRTLLDSAKVSCDDLYMLMTTTGESLKGISLGHFWNNSAADKVMKIKLADIANKLNEYGALQARLTEDAEMQALFEQTRAAIAFIFKSNSIVLNAINMNTNLSENAIVAAGDWKELMNRAGCWNKVLGEEYKALSTPAKTEEHKQSITSVPRVQQHKSPSSAHHYSVGGPQDPEGSELVKKLQLALGLTGNNVDGKFGANTFAAVIHAADKNGGNNYNLQSYLENAQHYAKDYRNWDKNAVIEATHTIEKFKNNGQVEQNLLSKSTPPLIPSPPVAQRDRVIDPYQTAADKNQALKIAQEQILNPYSEEQSKGDQIERQFKVYEDDITDALLEKFPDFKLDIPNKTVFLSGKSYPLNDKVEGWLMEQAGKDLSSLVSNLWTKK